MSLWERALTAVSAVKVVEALTSVRDRARVFLEEEEQVAAGTSSRETYFKLAALLAVWDAKRLKKARAGAALRRMRAAVNWWGCTQF